MLEFIGTVALIIAIIVLIDDDVHISFKIGDKDIIKYDKEDAKDGKEKDEQ